MAITDGITRTVKKGVFTDSIRTLSTDGVHTLGSGRVARALTDETLTTGDRVIVIKDDLGNFNIIAGKK